MPVCTLPAPVSPQLLGWCPRVKIVLFVSEAHLIMCRQSGQQVWNTKLLPPSPGAKPVSMSWSPDGQYFALVFTDGAYTVHQVSNGRQPSSFRPDQTNVASVAWASTGAAIQISSGYSKIDASTALDESHSSVAAMGTLDGRLQISVYGALNIGELAVNTGSASAIYQVSVDDDTKEYAAVQDSWLYVYRMSDMQGGQPVCESKRLKSMMKWLGSSEVEANRSPQSEVSARQSARAVELGATLVRSCSKFADSLKEAHKQVQSFFQVFSNNSKSPNNILLAAALYGTLDPLGAEWIQAQHEQGFKRWYKSLSQSFDALRKLLSDDILLSLEELLTVVDDLPGMRGPGVTHVSEAHEMVFKLIGEIVEGSQRFELQACFIEFLFREETDRPIAVAKLSKVTLSDVVESFVGSDALLGLPDIQSCERLDKLVAAVQSNLNDAVQETRDSLRSQVQLCYALDVRERVRALKRQSDGGGYRLILESGALVAVDASGIVTSADAVTRFGAVFTGKNCDVISLDAEKKHLILPDGSHKPLAFDPAAAAAYFDGEIVTVCVLSEDCQHYEFLSF